MKDRPNPSKNQGSRPSLGNVECQRRRRLETALLDVRTVLDASVDDLERHLPMVDAVAPLVSAAVAEIAVLDRQTDAADPAVVRRYGRMVEQALDLGDEPWRAFTLWRSAATATLEQFGVTWRAFLEQTARDSEGRHLHRKLVALEQISAALNLTRPRIASIFGGAKCSLPPVLLKNPTFSTAEQRDIRALSQRIGLSAEYIRDLALTLDPVAFCDKVLVLELLILPDMDKHRMLGSSDVAVSRSVRRLCPPSKPGPKPRNDTRTAQIAAVARHRRVSRSTMFRLLSDYAEWLEIPDPAVTLTPNCCHSDTEFDAVRFRDFGSLSNLEIPEFVTLFGVVVTDPDLVAIASLPRHQGPRARVGRKRFSYADKELVVAWWQATRNETPSPDQIRQWASRGHYEGYRNSALIWQAERVIVEREDRVETHAGRPLRLVVDNRGVAAAA